MIEYKLSETRLRQHKITSSAANATTLNVSGAVPENKIWIIHAFSYYPSAAETKAVSILKYVPAFSGGITIINPVSVALDPAKSLMFTFIEQGMEYFLFPGEYLICARESATAGSTMSAAFQFTEIDIPLYTYDDPITVKRQERALSSIRTQLGGGLGFRGVVPPAQTGERGGRGGPLPK